MRIAVIGWGSLIWCPGELRIASRWHRNGPLLPVEFSRVSQDGRLTLVIAEGAAAVTTLWALSELDDKEQAADNLRYREGTTRERIGDVTLEKNSTDRIHTIIKAWLERMSLEGAVWTSLPPKKPRNHEESLMTAQEASDYIRLLPEDIKGRAEQYVRNTPEQIDTVIRERLRRDFSWHNNPLPPILFVD